VQALFPLQVGAVLFLPPPVFTDLTLLGPFLPPLSCAPGFVSIVSPAHVRHFLRSWGTTLLSNEDPPRNDTSPFFAEGFVFRSPWLLQVCFFSYSVPFKNTLRSLFILLSLCPSEDNYPVSWIFLLFVCQIESCTRSMRGVTVFF